MCDIKPKPSLVEVLCGLCGLSAQDVVYLVHLCDLLVLSLLEHDAAYLAHLEPLQDPPAYPVHVLCDVHLVEVSAHLC